MWKDLHRTCTAVNLPINLLFGNVLVAVVVVVCLSCLMSYGRLPFQWTPWDPDVLRQLKYLMSVIMWPQKQFTLRYFANALRGELDTPACRLSSNMILNLLYHLDWYVYSKCHHLGIQAIRHIPSFLLLNENLNIPPKYHDRVDLSDVSTGSRGPLLNVLPVKFPVQLSRGRVLQISSDRDDRMGTKIKTPKYPWTKIEPKQNPMPDFQLTLNLKLTSHMRKRERIHYDHIKSRAIKWIKAFVDNPGCRLFTKVIARYF